MNRNSDFRHEARRRFLLHRELGWDDANIHLRKAISKFEHKLWQLNNQMKFFSAFWLNLEFDLVPSRYNTISANQFNQELQVADSL